MEAAYILEKKYELLVQPERIGHIMRDLTERFKQSPSIRSDLSRYLPDKYKAWTYNKKECYKDKSVADATFFDDQTAEDLIENADRMISNPYAHDPRKLVDVADKAYRFIDKLEEIREDTGRDLLSFRTPKIPNKRSELENNNRTSLEPGDPVTDEQTLTLYKEWANKRRELGDLEYKIADDIEEYPSNDPEIPKLGIKEADARLRLLKRVPDDRVTTDHEDWMEAIEKRRKESSSGIPPSREWKTKHDLGTGRVRDRNPMVKEQTDALAPKIIRDFSFMFRFSGEKALFKNRKISKGKKLLERKRKVSPKQSESA